MRKLVVRVALLGSNRSLMREIGSLPQLQSRVLTFLPEIDEYELRAQPDLDEWMYSTKLLTNICPKIGNEDLLFVIASAPLERNYIALRLGEGRVVVTARDAAAILALDGIPFRNLIIRYAYALALLKLCDEKYLAQGFDWESYAHADTRGCLFDMTPLKYDLGQSCDSPSVCSECAERLSKEGLARNRIDAVRQEIRRNIGVPLYWRINRVIRRRPVLSFFSASLWALAVGTLSSVLASSLTG